MSKISYTLYSIAFTMLVAQLAFIDNRKAELIIFGIQMILIVIGTIIEHIRDKKKWGDMDKEES